MKQKPKKYYSRLGGEYADIDDTMTRIRSEMSNLGYEPFKSAVYKVEQICIRATRAGNIDSKYSFGLVASTLLLGGAEKAKEEGTNRIRVNHIMRAWGEGIAVGNCPPYKCVRRSILTNQSEIFKRFRDLETIQENVLADLDK